jgi:hypothetical protein
VTARLPLDPLKTVGSKIIEIICLQAPGAKTVGFMRVG